ncbi:MAG: hypothetical protein JXB50_06830 [Spirochaetes bacterium]|nr:hypothetical protein [Spirochaetota bacterium]
MFKIIYYLLISLLIFLFNCTVNETTGIISVYNNTERDFKSVAINGTKIAFFLNSYKKTDYWFYKKLQGKITIIRNDNNHSFITNESYEFDLYNYYEMKISVKDNCYRIIID